MDLALKILLGLFAALFLVLGAQWMLTPAAAAGGVEMSLLGPVGLNTARGDIGGAFASLFVFVLLGLLTGRAQWLRAAAVVLACVAAGRVIGLLMDGVASASVSALGAEIFMLVVLHLAIGRADAATASSAARPA